MWLRTRQHQQRCFASGEQCYVGRYGTGRVVSQSCEPTFACEWLAASKWGRFVDSTSVSPPSRSMGSGDHWRGRQQRAQGGTSADATWGGPRYEKRAHNDRDPSPTSSRNGRYSVSSASSIANSSVSSNWRNSSLSTASSASSAFTRYSNASVRSVSTTATSVSGGSWRNQSTTSLSSVGNGKPGSVQVSAGSSVSSVRSDASKVPPPNVKSE